MSHSKRNTSLAFFTSYERALLRTAWGSQSTRLTRDSFLPFGSCQLCLLPANDPVACPGCPPQNSPTPMPVPSQKTKTHTRQRQHQQRRPTTHIFCRECAVANLLAQKQEIKRLQRQAEIARMEAEESEKMGDEEARGWAVVDFERTQAGLDGGDAVDLARRARPGDALTGRSAAPNMDVDGADAIAVAAAGAAGGTTKRKFVLNDDDLMRNAAEENKKARRMLEQEKQVAQKDVPSFWLPSQAVTVGTKQDAGHKEKERKMQPLCPGSTESSPHIISLKGLTAVRFSGEEAAATEAGAGAGSGTALVLEEATKDRQGRTRSCPSCARALSNASKAVLLKPCGHVLCGPCVDKFMLGGVANTEHMWEEENDAGGDAIALSCYVCSTNVTSHGQTGPTAEQKESRTKMKKKKKDGDGGEGNSGLYDIACEGTGFAGGGTNLVKREGVAFQC